MFRPGNNHSKTLSIVIFFFVFAPYFLKASNYYFSSLTGDDSRSSKLTQHSNTPWKTLSQLNSFFSNLKPGDSILFKRGETFNGAINVTRSGFKSSPIVFGVYGSGPMPLISGFAPLSCWNETSKGVYKAVSTSHLPEMKMLLLNGIQQPMGRYPNSGYLTYQSHVENNSIKSDQLTGIPGWKGAEIVIRKNRWVLDRCKIISRKGAIISYTGGTKDLPTDGYGYFIQDDPGTLDQLGEWYFDPSEKEVYVFFGNMQPSKCKVYVSDQSSLVVIDNQRFVKFENLSFEGADISAFKVSNSQNISIQHCNISQSARDAIDASGSSYLSIENCFIDHSQNDAINLDMGCTFAAIRSNKVRNTGLLPGMGESGTGSYQAVSVFGDNSIVEFNEIDSTGYNSIYFGGNSTTVKNNRIGYFCSVKDDGAGIYVGDWRVTIRKSITNNIVFNGIGAPQGTRPGNSRPQVEGIYIDDNSSDINIQSNAISNCPDAGIKIHNAHEVNIEGNTVFNNGIQLLIAEDTFSSHSAVKNISCYRNIFRCQSAGQLCLNIISTADDIDSFVRMDNNFYYRPGDDHKFIQLVSRIWSVSSLTKNLSVSQWQEMYKQDRQSKSVLWQFQPLQLPQGFREGNEPSLQHVKYH